MQMADAEAAAARESHHRAEQQQLFQFMTKTMQSLSAGTVERDAQIEALHRTVRGLEQALALAVSEVARAEAERSAGTAAEAAQAAALAASAASEAHRLQNEVDTARAAAAAAATALADALAAADQAAVALAAAEREKDALFRALDAANQGAATAADMMRYVEDRDAQRARERAALEAAHAQVRYDTPLEGHGRFHVVVLTPGCVGAGDGAANRGAPGRGGGGTRGQRPITGPAGGAAGAVCRGGAVVR